MFSEGLHLAVNGDRGSITTELLRIGATGTTLGRVISTGHEIELREVDSITFLLPRAGRLDIQVSGHDYSVPSGCLMAFRPSQRRTRASAGAAGGFAAATLQVRMDRMRELAEAGDVPSARTFARDGVALAGDAGLLLAHNLPRLADDLFLFPDQPLPSKVARAIGHLIDDQLCELLEISSAQACSQRILPAFHRVRQAEEMMRSRSGEALSMLEIARACGVGLRSLQLAFKDVHGGQSPRDVLGRIRLDKARRLLLSDHEDLQVTTVAMDCGFFHLGRFAQAYARAYGERPSETLARRRGDRPPTARTASFRHERVDACGEKFGSEIAR
jgi:AraC-like DNA-binding protein